MKGLVLVLALAACAGCASGGPDAATDASTGSNDATPITIDSMMVDVPSARTLSQTQSDQIEAATSIACPAASGGTAANNYYRVFDLAAFGITGDFHVTQVSFQVEHCDDIAGAAGATMAVRVGTYSGVMGDTLTAADMTILASNPNVLVPEVIEDLGPPAVTPGGTVNAPLSATIPAGSKLLVEVDAPDGDGTYYFYMGANNDGESAPGYILAPRCSVTVPTNVSTVTSPAVPVHLLLTVSGTY